MLQALTFGNLALYEQVGRINSGRLPLRPTGHGVLRRIYGVAGTGSRCRRAASSGAQLPGAALPRRYWVLDGGAVPERAWGGYRAAEPWAVAYYALLVQVRILLGSRYSVP